MYVNIASEDEISELVCERIIEQSLPDYRVNLRLRKGGNGYLRSKLPNFNRIALREPVLVLTDLDTGHCPTELINSWVGNLELAPHLFFRIVVREIEAWLMADRDALSDALGIPIAHLPAEPETVLDPKRHLLNAARHAPRAIRQELLVTRGSVASQGIGYNRLLGNFVIDRWSPQRASERSPSLARCIARISTIGH